MTQVAPWAWMLIGMVLTLGGGGGIVQSLAQKNPVWLLMLVPFAFLAFFIAPYKIWKLEHVKVLGYETVNLDIFYDDDNGSCKRVDLLPNGRGTQTLWRVGVTGAIGKLTEDVILELNKAEPNILDIPAVLRLMSRDNEGEGSFNIRPDATQYVEVLRYNRQDGDDSLWAVFQRPPAIGKRIEFCSYTLHLVARGIEGPSKSATFCLEVGN